MPMEAQPRLNLPMLTVLRAAGVLGHEVLAVADVPDALVAPVLGIHGEEAVLARVRELAEGGDQGGEVAVADVVLPAVGAVAAIASGLEGHLRRVEVRAVGLLRQAEGEDRAVFEQRGGLAFDRLVLAHPDRTEAQHRHLPGVPVLEPVERQDLGELADPPGVPARVLRPVARRRAHRGEDPLVAHEVEEVLVPDRRVIILLEPLLSLGLEELDRLPHHLAGTLVGILAVVLLGLKEDHGGFLPWWSELARSRRYRYSSRCPKGSPVAQSGGCWPRR